VLIELVKYCMSCEGKCVSSSNARGYGDGGTMVRISMIMTMVRSVLGVLIPSLPWYNPNEKSQSGLAQLFRLLGMINCEQILDEHVT